MKTLKNTISFAFMINFIAVAVCIFNGWSSHQDVILQKCQDKFIETKTSFLGEKHECLDENSKIEVIIPSANVRDNPFKDTTKVYDEKLISDSKPTQIIQKKSKNDSLFHSRYNDYYCDDKCYKISKLKPRPFAIDSLRQSIDTIDHSPMLSIDIDGDCVPEIMINDGTKANFYYRYYNSILFIDSQTGKTKKKLKTAYFMHELCGYVAGDIDNDGSPEIIIAAKGPQNPIEHQQRLICYNLDGTIKWVSNSSYYFFLQSSSGSLGLADFNHDGIPEVYYGNKIFNAQNGALLINGGFYGVGSSVNSQSTTIAGDFNGDGNLELAAGNTVYTVDIININGLSGNTMTPFQLSNEFYDGLTSVADINEDGILDIIVNPEGSRFTFVYIYSFINNKQEIIATYNLDDFRTTTFVTPAHVYDLAGTGEKSILIGGWDKILCLKYDKSTSSLYKSWEIDRLFHIFDQAPDAFDFNNDGLMEIFAKSFNQIKIYNEVNGIITAIDSIKCQNLGNLRIIGNKSQSLLCLTCVEKIQWVGNSGYYLAKLAIYGPPSGERWTPARKIWNQYAYNPLFINDDGTVPQFMENPATFKNGKYNNFMLQESLIDEDGNVALEAASLSAEIHCVDFDVNTQKYNVHFSINNKADASASALKGLPVAFYNGNPETVGSLVGVYNTTTDLLAGDTISGLSYSFGSSDLTSIFMIINTDQFPITIADSSNYLIDECDYTDNVFIAMAPKITRTTEEICEGDSFTFYNETLVSSGTYYHEVSDKTGCDSLIVALELNVSNVKTESLTTSVCDSYDWNGQTYTTDGVYTHQTLSVNGCDSITTLNLNVFSSNNISQTQQSCDSYFWNGQTYTNSGIYTYKTQNIHNCDSIVTLDLKIYPSAETELVQAACYNYEWNGQNYTESGTYIYKTQTRYGCDSTVTLDLTISDIIRTQQNVTACDSYDWNGQTYDTEGAYTFNGQSINGCDSIATLQLIIHPSTASTMTHTACDTFLWKNMTYDESGLYTYPTQNIFGCDSLVTLALTIHKTSTSISEINACKEYSWNGESYDHSGTYVYQTSNAKGCDSLATLQLNIYQPDEIMTLQTACDSYQWNDQTFTESGMYTHQTQNIFGCDSLTTLLLTVHPSNALSFNLTACDSLNFLDQTLTTSGSYTFGLQNQYGCDSTITLNLTISGNKSNSIQSGCQQYLWPINGKTYTSSGTYTERYTNALGCDSTHTLELRIHPEYAFITDAEACAQFVWPLTQQRYTQTGKYTLPLKTAEGCDSIFTLDLVIHPEFEFRDTVIATEPYYWSINNQTYDSTGIYAETFRSEISCDSIHYLHLTINDNSEVFFPNIISPIGVNAFFTGYSNNASIQITSLAIYDRWGNVIFAKENFPANDPDQGWDGKYKGKEVAQGVYIWKAVVKLKDGSLQTHVGDVMVMK
jgi:hypothetical protein